MKYKINLLIILSVLFTVGIAIADNLVYKILIDISVVNHENIIKIKKFTEPTKGQPLFETKLFNSGSPNYMWLEVCSTNTNVSNAIDSAINAAAIKNKVFLIQKSWIDAQGNYQNNTISSFPLNY